MIRLIRNDSGETVVQIGLANGWCASFIPSRSDTDASLIAWQGHQDHPRGKVIVGEQEATAEELIEFLNHVAGLPEAETVAGKSGTIIIDEAAGI